MISNKSLQLIIFCLTLSGCGIFKQTAKQELVDGFYTQKANNQKTTVCIEKGNEELTIYATRLYKKKRLADTLKNRPPYLNITSKDVSLKNIILSKQSFDVDFLTTPLKYRGPQANVPSQLNATLNGALYLGFRTDKYLLNYKLDPLGKMKLRINHLGISMGAFVGLGNTAMNPTNTNDILQKEYDGIVWSKGIAGIVAVNNFTIGLTLGFDNLLDKNRNIWIYETKPWVGITFGLNLN